MGGRTYIECLWLLGGRAVLALAALFIFLMKLMKVASSSLDSPVRASTTSFISITCRTAPEIAPPFVDFTLFIGVDLGCSTPLGGTKNVLFDGNKSVLDTSVDKW